MITKNYLLFFLLLMSMSLYGQENTNFQSRLILKTHPTKLIDFYRPAIPLSIEWNDGRADLTKRGRFWGKSIVIRQSYKPKFYNSPFARYQEKKDHHAYRMEVEVRVNRQFFPGRELFFGVSSFFSRSHSIQGIGRYYIPSTSNNDALVVNFDSANVLETRNGGFFSVGYNFNTSKVASFEVSASFGVEEVGYNYENFENAIILEDRSLWGVNDPEKWRGRSLWPYFRIDFAIGLNLKKISNRN